MESDTSLGNRIATETEAYADRIETCVGLLPELLEQYRAGTGYHDTADRIRALESACDRDNRRLAALVTNATAADLGLWNSRIQLNTPQLVRLYQKLDAVPNAAERIAEELVTIEPTFDDACFENLSEMAEQATRAVSTLVTAITRFVRVLATPSEEVAIADEIETIREIESRCDGSRNEIVAAAFRDDSATNPLVYREFALCFDAVVDAAEDVSDQLVLLSSTESWVVTEPDRRRQPEL